MTYLVLIGIYAFLTVSVITLYRKNFIMKQAYHKISHDALTGLCNQAHFSEKASRLLATPGKRLLICSDITSFKMINELFGVEIGNKLLQKQADFIKRHMNKTMVYGRLGEDRFAVIINETDYHEKYFDACIREMKQVLPNDVFHLQVCFGIYEIGERDRDIISMCDKAVMAIDSIKGDYHKHVAYYQKEVMEHVIQENKIIGEFETALQNGEFRMYLQPQLSANGSIVGAEALVRWIKADGQVLMPDEFIGILEQTGQIYGMDQSIWEQAAKELKTWQSQGISYHISVNISAKDRYYTDLYKEFVDLTQQYQIPPERLHLEITESAYIHNLEYFLELITKLQDYGFVIEIDDFGSGYSSLNLLKDMKADVLKLDRMFLRETENKARSRIILQSIADMATRLQMPIICEGVERKEQLRYLTELGCETFQGYYFSKPICIDEFEQKYIRSIA